MSTIALPFGRTEKSLAQSAACWMCAFHRGVSARVEGQLVTLEGYELSEADLKRLWNAALLNERAHAQNEEKRRQVLEQLSR